MKKLTPESFYSDYYQLLKNTSVFGSLHETTLQYFIYNQPIYQLKPGDTLDPRNDSDSLRIVIVGQIAIRTPGEATLDEQIGKIESGEFVELNEDVLGVNKNITLEAVENTVIMEFTQDNLSLLMKKQPRRAHEVTLLLQNRVRQRQLVSTIREILKIDEHTLQEKIGKHITWVHLRSGNTLFQQNDPSDGLYILINGRLNVFIRENDKEEKLVGEVVPGESVGEMGFFTREPRTATVRALRDSVVIKFTKESFEKIIKQHPEFSTHIINTLIDRLRKVQHITVSATSSTNICIIASNKNVPLHAFINGLEKALSNDGPVLCLTDERLEQLTGIPDAAQVSPNNPYNITILNWLIEQESRYRYILFITDDTSTYWTKRCIRHADQFVVAGNFYDQPDITGVENFLYRLKNNRWSPKINLVLLHPDNSTMPDGTINWLHNREIDHWYHVRMDQSGDYERLARFLSGRAVGLVLGGGGARGFAHIGVIRALIEHNIPIDIIGGTSMGSFIATQYAMGRSYRDMLRINKWGWIDNKPLTEYTIPVFALIRGQRIKRGCSKVYGNTQFEDLWIPCFCISSNLSTADIMIHNKGPVAEAVQASAAIPGVAPPAIKDGEILVDGSLLNNLPIDIMRKMGGGKIIAVDVSQGKEMKSTLEHFPSPWEYLSKRIFSRNKSPMDIPTILEVLARSAILSSNRQLQLSRKDADLYIRPPLDHFSLLEFKALTQIAEHGYTFTKELLQQEQLQFV